MTTEHFDPFAGGELLRVSPTTWPQKEIIASAQMSDEANTSFNEAVSITIEGELNVDLLQSSFDKLLERHETLRATFSRRGDEICLHEVIPFNLEYIDIRLLSREKKEDEIQHLWRNIAISPMSLEEGPLMFAWLLQLEENLHELIIAGHHVICDGWTFGLLLNELTAIYANNGHDHELPPAESFFDFAEEIEAKETANTDIDYWQVKFEKLPPVMDLPLDRMRPTNRTFQARRFDYDLDQELVKLLPKVAAQMKASLVNVVLSGYFTLLYRLTGSHDLVVGLPVAGQAAMNRRNQAGHMVQLLPIRIQIDDDTTFNGLVDSVKSEVLNSSERPNFTFGKLLENITVDRSRVPLINTIFNIDQPMGLLHFGSAEGRLRTIPRAAENFEIFLNILPTRENFTIEATYSTPLFSEETIKAWLEGLEAILWQVVNTPEINLSDLALTQKVPEILIKSNATDVAIQNPDFINAFQAQTTKTPEAIAVICGEIQLTYKEVHNLSSGAARFLKENGIQEGDIVGLCCERSEQMLIALLAIFKIGAAYLPLDPDFPEDRLVYMVDDAAAVAVIEDEAAPVGVKNVEVKHIQLGEIAHLSPGDSEIALPKENPDRLAYIIYTSGSTGKPKGVRVQNIAMINFLESMAREPGCFREDRLLAVTTLSFDISVLELYMPLLCGAVTVIASRAEAKDGDKLADLIRKYEINLLQATPSTWRMLLASEWREFSEKNLHLRALCGGEPLPPDLIVDLVPHVKELWNMFGPTETTVWSTCKRILLSDPLISVGKPIANTQVYILDQHLRPLPTSCPGELFIGGDGVTLGYNNRDDLNKERFLTHPDFGLIYRTGDQAKLLPTGEVQHMGRLDDQVKVRGYRIELGEIESALVACDEVSAAAVYLWELSPEDIRLVACCVAEIQGDFQHISIRKQLRKTLPNYMVPQYLLEISEIPLTPNNKVNRRALPRPELTETTILSSSTLISDSEKTIGEIWTDLIKPSKPIGREDNFFEIGGHSLLALEAIRQLEKATGKRVGFDKFVRENLASIAETISADLDSDTVEQSNPEPLAATSRRGLSLEQNRILLRHLDFPDTVCNNLPASWVLGGKLDLDVFTKSFERVMERQTALRTVIHRIDTGYYQSLQHVKETGLPEFEDLSHLENSLKVATEKAIDLAARPFTVTGNILIRAKLFKLSDTEHLFVFIPHQLIFDGWSFDVFLTELQAAYLSLSGGTPPATNPIPFEFRDYTQWSLDREIDSETLDFHREALEAEFVGQFVKEGNNGVRCARKEISFTKSELEAVEIFCSTHELRLHEFLFAGFAKALSDNFNERNIIIGIPVTGRYSPDVIGLIGSFVSVLPCKISIEGQGFVTIAKSVANKLSSFHNHQDASYAEIIEGTSWEDDLFPTNMSTSFSFQDVRNRPRSLAELELSQIDMPRDQTELPFEFWVRIHKGGFLAVFDYDAGRVYETTIDQLIKKIGNLYKNLDHTVDASLPATDKKKSLWRKLFKR